MKVFFVNDSLDVMLVCRHAVHTHVCALTKVISELQVSWGHVHRLSGETGDETCQRQQGRCG